jgi:hypothetical protein
MDVLTCRFPELFPADARLAASLMTATLKLYPNGVKIDVDTVQIDAI